MDFYQKNPTTLRRLLTKRQNPCTQIFKTQASNPTNGPMPTMNLSRNDIYTTQEEQKTNFASQNMTETPNPPMNLSHHESQTSQTTTSTVESASHNSSHTSEQIDEEDDEDAACLENVQKKIKTTMLTPNTMKLVRRTSYEEEKEESEQHSTSCETRSEFNIANETGDFMFSPSMSHLPSKNVTEIKLDGNDGTPQREGFHMNPSTEENPDLIKTLPCSKQRVKCKLNHQCEVEVVNTAKKSCPRCADLLHECREFARKNEGSCLNEEYDETIRYRCIKGHCWTLNHKNARRRWCAQCAKEQRAFLKKKCEEEKVEREKQEEENQKKLFEEAKKQAMKDNMKQQPQQPFGFSGTNNGCGSQRPMSTLEYFQRIDYEIESLAKKYTLEFMSQKTFTGETTFQQILQVYKIMIMPEEILQTYMFNLNADTLRSEFRRMAKIIHPDKNKHPQAGNAFQKIHKVYEVALSRLDATKI